MAVLSAWASTLESRRADPPMNAGGPAFAAILLAAARACEFHSVSPDAHAAPRPLQTGSPDALKSVDLDLDVPSPGVLPNRTLPPNASARVRFPTRARRLEVPSGSGKRVPFGARVSTLRLAATGFAVSRSVLVSAAFRAYLT